MISKFQYFLHQCASFSMLFASRIFLDSERAIQLCRLKDLSKLCMSQSSKSNFEKIQNFQDFKIQHFPHPYASFSIPIASRIFYRFRTRYSIMQAEGFRQILYVIRPKVKLPYFRNCQVVTFPTFFCIHLHLLHPYALFSILIAPGRCFRFITS